MSDENLVRKLCAFNLSPNQARVYAFLAKSEQAVVRQISESTHIHEQDIYKALAVLQKKGLALRTGGTPVKFQAIPVEEGLTQIINSIHTESKEEIRILKKYYVDIKKEVKTIKSKSVYPQNSSIVVLSKEAPLSRIDLAFDTLKKSYDTILPDGSFKWLEYCKGQFKKIVKRCSPKIRILIITTSRDEAKLASPFEKIIPKSAIFEIRSLRMSGVSYITLIDSREVWFGIPSIGIEEAMIITDAREIVEIAKLQFEVLWNDSNSKTVAKGL